MRAVFDPAASRCPGMHRKTVLLPDRNVTSRFARIAKGAEADEQMRLVAAIMAFAQCLEIQIEPSVAFHELAYTQGNASANEELAWFRASDNGKPQRWIDYALGRITCLPGPYQPHAVAEHDLIYPLHRWRRNYAAALKIGGLELDGLPPLQRIFGLLDWMEHDFIVAGPAAIMACLYFAPNSPPRKGLLKQLKSADRERGIAGTRNAAWDVTYLSDFVRRVNDTSDGSVRYLFASLDKSLQRLAGALFEYGADGLRKEAIVGGLEQWWPRADAETIAARLEDLFSIVNAQDSSVDRSRSAGYVDEAIARGERKLREFGH